MTTNRNIASADGADGIGEQMDPQRCRGKQLLLERADGVNREAGRSGSPAGTALTDAMGAFLHERRLAFVSAATDGRPAAEPCLDDPGYLRVLGDGELAWPAGAMVDERRAPLESGDTGSLSVLAVDWWNSTVGLEVSGVGKRHRHPPVGVTDDGSATDWYVLDVDATRTYPGDAVPQLAPETAPSTERADAAGRTTYDRVVSRVRRAIDTRPLALLATVDDDGRPALSPRTGPEGFVQILDAHTLAWPEYPGTGQDRSLSNIDERGVANLLFVDWADGGPMVQVTGSASRYESVAGATDPTSDDCAAEWVLLDVDSATVAADPPLPSLSVESFDPDWGGDAAAATDGGTTPDR